MYACFIVLFCNGPHSKGVEYMPPTPVPTYNKKNKPKDDERFATK